MKQVLVKQGKAVVEFIPAPLIEPGSVLVQVDQSCISIGTEMSGVQASGVPLWKRLLRQPQNLKKGLHMLATQGFKRTHSLVQSKLAVGSPTGYSAAGTIIEVGAGVLDLKPGDRVACAGAQCAHHAAVLRVPRNLTVPIPESLDFASASTVTLGAIALQGVRRAQPTLGETFVVIGLGILGQLTTQLLRTNGCRVIGTDLDPERIAMAETLGMTYGLHAEDGGDIEAVMRLTGGIGADGVIITAATRSHEVVSTAFKLCRKKGRVVLVGDVGLNLNRADFYQKELDFFISSSYGPGRYDGKYEEQGLDYPVAYVRWTENRNMGEYLALLAEGKVDVRALISATYPLDQATAAYELLKVDSRKPLMVLLSYPQPAPNEALSRRVMNHAAVAAGPRRIRMAIVGAGSFAKGMHLPNLESLSEMYHIQAIVSRTGHNAVATARQCGANYATTDFEQVLADPEVDAVLLATRHNLHGTMALQALKAGKHVLVEKPLALTAQELQGIKEFYGTGGIGTERPILLTGFNRRFSKYAVRIAELTRKRTNPMILNYRMNAGYIPLDHWVHGEEGGGRNRGEACHIYDLFTYLTGSEVKTVRVSKLSPSAGYYSSNDNFVATMTFSDGSVASLTYCALGAKEYPKEQLEVFVDGKVIVLADYKQLTISGAKAKGLSTSASEKGQREELQAFGKAIQHGGDWPIPLWQQFQATEISFSVETELGGTV